MTKDSAGIAARAAPGDTGERRLRQYLATMADALGASPLRRPLVLIAAGIFAVILATAIQRARTPSYSMSLEASPGQPYTDFIGDEINLWVVAGSDGILEFQLLREGGGTDFTSMAVVKGQKIEGHFAKIGPGTTCLPLVGFGNLG